ncbi:hypothetical protein FOMPIDRAFT_1055402 [Fomitopsis schrenkii]|uniref:Uncharacterized protein n=1 Tax=Fomitopsis schrenkii TaxID=2126942 RepID=S8DN54_FOMSC|nr:hypothetical protein FOMPIDRAFT_1055402 [Fomitopsis schrenkii]
MEGGVSDACASDASTHLDSRDLHSTTSSVLPKDPAQLELSDPVWAANLRLLRRHWKWAAFSQFFHTFVPLFAMNDVTLVDIEDDLARGLSLYLPRVMTRLLYTLNQDRTILVDSWQTALRKQYLRRGACNTIFRRSRECTPTTCCRVCAPSVPSSP